MSLLLPNLTRRQFLRAAGPLLGGSLGSFLSTRAICPISNNHEDTKEKIADDLLLQVNDERFLARVPKLEIDDLACRVATSHADDMASGSFISHWGRDGRKPYHRYSFAGGIHATQENIASVDNVWSVNWKDLRGDLIAMHMRMHAERPPNDGHRKTILARQHTHVGFGVAIDERRLRLVEMYVAKYLEIAATTSRAKRGSTLELSGKLLNRRHILQQIEIFYESMPKPPSVHFLSTPRSYALPEDYKTLRPKLPQGVLYSDRLSGLIELDSAGRFRVPVRLFKNSPGIYTIVCWIRRNSSEKAFPATEICIESE